MELRYKTVTRPKFDIAFYDNSAGPSSEPTDIVPHSEHGNAGGGGTERKRCSGPTSNAAPRIASTPRCKILQTDGGFKAEEVSRSYKLQGY